MTIKECYEKMGADYENIYSRLGDADMIEYLATYRYSIIFIDNQSFFVNEDIIALFKRKNYVY